MYFKLKIQTKNMFPTKYFTNHVAQMFYWDLPKDLNILTKRFADLYIQS